MKICPKCSVYGSDLDLYCYKDGSQMVDVKKCACGRQIGPVDEYCPKCGRKVEGKA